MKPGTILFTKDGRKIGNAIVIKNFVKYDLQLNRIKTDFGNVANFTDDEINEFFYIAEEEWLAELRVIYGTRDDNNMILKWFFDKLKLFFVR